MSQLLEHADPVTVVVLGLTLCAAVAGLLRRKVRPAVESTSRALAARLRPYAPARIRRLARICLHRIDPETARSMLVTGIAAGIACAAAGILGLVGPVTAAISATLSVQLSSHASIREGAQRLIATLAGLAVAVAVWSVFGITPVSIAVIAVSGLAVGRLLRLGDTAVAVPLTSLGVMVAGSVVTETFVWQRVASTALGIVVGVILSPLVGGVTPLERARDKLAHLSAEIAKLLADLAAGARDGCDREQAALLLARSRDLDEDLDDAVDAVDELARQARWSLTTPVAEVRPLQETLRALEHGVHQVNSVARSMFDAAASPHGADVPEPIGHVLEVASGAFATHASLVADPQADGAEETGQLDDQLHELREARRRTLRTVRNDLADTGVLVLTGSILTDVDRMAGSLARSAPALTIGVPEHKPGIPAVSEALPAVRRIFDKRRDRTAA